jgi:hypothetical protein
MAGAWHRTMKLEEAAVRRDHDDRRPRYPEPQ